MRPSLDVYFLTMAKLVAWRSTCTRRQVGAVLVMDRHVISTGYNETPRGLKNCGDGGCLRCKEYGEPGADLELCLCVHAEQNAIAQAAYHGQATKDAVLYTLYLPCRTCAKLIINAGICRVVYCYSYPALGVEDLLFMGHVSLVHVNPSVLPFHVPGGKDHA